MGPRFCKRGNKPTRSGDNVILLLQWGHAFVSVETAQGDGQRQPGHQVLQWGHAFVSVETSSSMSSSSFNGATLL